MKLSGISTLLIVLLLAIAMFASTGSLLVSAAHSPDFGPSAVSFNGTINITAGGAVDYNGTGSTDIVASNGNNYTLEGNVYGTINIMHNYTLLNGQNFSISNNSGNHYFSLNISGASHVSVEFLKIDTAYQPGIFVNLSSNDTFSHLNVSSALVSLLVGAHTDHLKFLNSKFSLNTSKIAQTFEADSIVTGSLPSADFGAFVNSSSNITFANDTINNLALNYYGTAAFVNSASTVFDNVTFNLFAAVGITTDKNDTAVMNSHFNGYAQYGISASPNYFGMVSSIDLIDNTFNLTTRNFNSGYPIEAVSTLYANITIKGNTVNIGNASSNATGNVYYGITSFNSNLKLFNNHIVMNNTGYNVASGLYVNGGNLTLIGNNISMVNTENDNSYAVEGSNSNITAANNTFFYQSVSSSITGYGIDSSGGLLIANHNRIVSSGASITGISATGNSKLSIVGNAFNLSNSPVLEALNANSIEGNSDNNISGNSVYETGTSSSAVGFHISNLRNLTFEGNALYQSGSNLSDYYGLETNMVYNAALWDNTFNGPDNLPEHSYGLFLQDQTNSTFANSTVSGYNTTIYSDRSSNLSFDGNYFSNTSVSLNLTFTNNSIFYHNDFMAQNNHSFQIVTSSNDAFDLPLPVGGNYWGTYTGSDANRDGIGDTLFTVNGTFADHYPLMKPWTRPRVVFMAPSGLNGTPWSVTFNGKTLRSTGTEIFFNIINATYQNYSFEYHNTSFYYTNEQTGYFNYNGTGTSVNIPYLHYSYITGDLNLTNFTVYVNGKLVEVSGGKFNLTVIAGQYDVVIVSPGYATFNHTYNLTPGVTLRINTSLEKIPSNNSRLILEYILATGAVVAVAGGLVFYLRGRRRT